MNSVESLHCCTLFEMGRSLGVINGQSNRAISSRDAKGKNKRCRASQAFEP